MSTKSRGGPPTFCPARAIRGIVRPLHVGDILDASEIIQLLKQGWLTTVPLGLLSVIVFTIALERAWRYRGLEKATRDLARKQVDALVRRDVATARALCETSKTPIAEIFAEGLRWRNIALEDLNEVLNTGAPGGDRRAAARALVRRHDRLAGALHRPLRHRGRHHARLPRDRRHRRRRLRRGGLGHLRGADRHGGGPAGRDPRAAALQLAADAGQRDRPGLRALDASASCRRCSTSRRRPTRATAGTCPGRAAMAASARPDEETDDDDRRRDQHHSADGRVPRPADHLHGHLVGDREHRQEGRPARGGAAELRRRRRR